MIKRIKDGIAIELFGAMYARVGLVSYLRFGKFYLYERVDNVRRVFGHQFKGWRYAA